jgi:hypothetical protein
MNNYKQVSEKLEILMHDVSSKLMDFDYDSVLEEIIVEKNSLISSLQQENDRLRKEVNNLKKQLAQKK